jgi:hypothetical protein
MTPVPGACEHWWSISAACGPKDGGAMTTSDRQPGARAEHGAAVLVAAVRDRLLTGGTGSVQVDLHGKT